MLVIEKLTKTYASGVQALKGISLDVPAGMFGLLGPNGAGKTTLMKILATLLEPDSGTAQIHRKSPSLLQYVVFARRYDRALDIYL